MISIRRRRFSVNKKLIAFLMLTVFLMILSLIKVFPASKDELELSNILAIKFQEEAQKIFFIESTFFGTKEAVTLNSRQACSIESAALLNPEASIFIIFASNSNIRNSKIYKTLKKYDNIYFYRLNLHEFAMKTPLEGWIKNKTYLGTIHLKETISDILRLLLLWRYGGTYLDLDVVSQESLKVIDEPNFVCAQLNDLSNIDSLASGIMSLDSDYGRKIAKMCLEDFISNYNESVWGWNGPNLITRVIRKICLFEPKIISEKVTCSNFTILPSEKCYKVHFTLWPYFFRAKLGDDAMKLVNNSYFVHVWNSMSKNKKLPTNSSAAYIRLAHKFCPSVLRASGDFF